MLSKNIIKLVRSLEQKKQRKLHGLFVAEGPKVVESLLEHMTPHLVIATTDWKRPLAPRFDIIEASADELARASLLRAPQQVIALFPTPPNGDVGSLRPSDNLILALDGVQDPGNLGTIIRLADWFGIESIVCSHDTADAYSPKVVQATMGSIARVQVVYTDLPPLLQSFARQCPIYGTHLRGSNIYTASLQPRGFIVMGNEGKGISPAVERTLTHKLLIPPFKQTDVAESLNVAMATAIACSEFRRRGYSQSEID